MYGWEAFERFCQKRLKLSSTISSGNKFYDPSDGVDNRHHTETSFPLMIDCKYTTKYNYTLNRKMLRDWVRKTGEWGKRFALPLRFAYEEGDDRGPFDDYVVSTFDDFQELIEIQEAHRSCSATPVTVVTEPNYRTEEQDQALKTLRKFSRLVKDPTAKLKLMQAVDLLEEGLPCRDTESPSSTA
ncbi:hypothetical protein [Streptomyces sp. CoH17]|uniref:hypothetical protein n=1 Tax=Streptomyces sp. CoH17 TaxID=2992806 RepID=UPI00226DEF3E|nr:hypothetical protein [Streptomyces sp. CoH17]